MLNVGLTGGIACGKTTILAMFAKLGAHTVRADEVAHRLMAPGQTVYARIVGAFGPGILAPDGSISRPALAAIAFPDRIAELNAIVHPAVLAYEDDWTRNVGKNHPRAVAICEAALLIEAGGRSRYDKLIVVTCPLEQKISRFAARAAITLDAARIEVERRMAAQMPESEKVKFADFVIDNSMDKDAAQRRVLEIWQQLVPAARSL